MSQSKITPEIITKTSEWLGKDGKDFFTKIKREHGTVLAIWNEGGIPHPVHFREGMQVRNFLRSITGHSWTAHEYDDLWHIIVEKCIDKSDAA